MSVPFFFDRSLIGARRQAQEGAKRSAARARGLRFERKITELLLRAFPAAEAQVPICSTASGSVVAIPDLLLPLQAREYLIIEIKQSYFPDNRAQVEKYKSLLNAMGYASRVLIVCEDFYAPGEKDHVVTGCRALLATVRGARDFVVCCVSTRELKLVTRGLLNGTEPVGCVREVDTSLRRRGLGAGSGINLPGKRVEA